VKSVRGMSEEPTSDTFTKGARKAIGKADARYWLQSGKLISDPRWSGAYFCKVQVNGRRESFPLRTANKNAAASKAAKIYGDVSALGWDAALIKHKPESVKVAKAATVGALIEAAKRHSPARAVSLEAYAQALRRIVIGTLEMKEHATPKTKAKPRKRSKRTTRTNLEWRELVDATPLDKLTPTAVLAWKNAFLKAAKTPIARNSAVVSFNALLRNSKALLSKKVRPSIEKELILPSPLWFEGVARETEPSLRYHSQIDSEQILKAAQTELAESQPEVFKALLLTLICGLRRSEADSLLWRQFNFNAGTLEIANTEHMALKSPDSAGVIGLDAELVSLLRGFRARASGEFVLEEPTRRGDEPNARYRCNVHFKALIHWLKANKVPGIRPIHTLRKEIGSVIASRDGIFSASRYLRHSNISITAKLYADSKNHIAAGLGAFLTARPANIVEADFTTAAALPTRPTNSRIAKHRSS